MLRPAPHALPLTLALLLAGPASAAPLEALIWGAEPTAEAARARVPEVAKQLQAAGLTFPEGFPLAIRSDNVSGLKPGFEIIILGYCSPEQSRSVLQAAKAVQAGTYVRKVDVTPAGPSCPSLTSSTTAPAVAKPEPQSPGVYALVLAADRTEQDAERRLQEAQKGTPVKFAEGFPRRLHQKDIRLVPHSDPDVRARKRGVHLVIGGYCEERATRAIGELLPDAFFERVAGTAPPLACPQPTLESINRRLALIAESAELEPVQSWVSLGADQRGKDVALNLAAGHCHLESVKFLLGAGANPNADVSGVPRIEQPTALAAAAGGWCRKDGKNLLETVQALLSAGANPNLATASGSTPIELAAGNSLAAAKLLLERGADPKKAKRSPLVQAALAKHSELVRLFLERGVDVEQRGPCGSTGECTALVAATLAEDLDSLRLLRAKGASLEGRTPNGLTALDNALLYDFPSAEREVLAAALLHHPSTALHRAAFTGDVAAMKPLLSREKVDARQGGWTPLMLAALAGKADAVKALLAAGADPNLRHGEPGSSHGVRPILMLAAMGGSGDVVEQLLLAKADAAAPGTVCCGTDRWSTPYLPKLRAIVPWATIRGLGQDIGVDYSRTKLARVHTGLLPVAEWNYERYDKRDLPYLVRLTPLHVAALLGHTQGVDRLVAAGAAVDARDDSGLGLTPLMLASEEGHPAVMAALLKAGAGLDTTDAAGTPLLTRAVFRDAPRPAIEALLAKGGAKLLKTPGLLTAAARESSTEVVKLLIAKGAGKGGEGKRAAKSLCDRGRNSDRDAEVFNLLAEAGYGLNKSYFGDCAQEGD
jgi:ankyrin repeat protein